MGKREPGFSSESRVVITPPVALETSFPWYYSPGKKLQSKQAAIRSEMGSHPPFSLKKGHFPTWK